jgi:hypothetical protein
MLKTKDIEDFRLEEDIMNAGYCVLFVIPGSVVSLSARIQPNISQ